MADVGQDVESLCSKCGDVWHVVVAKVGTKVAKVQCKQCGKLHRYRPTDGSPASRAAPVRRKKAAGSSRSKKAAEPPAPTGPEVEPDMSKPIRTYSIRELFEPGERVDHPKFGVGVVEKSPAPGKIAVFFQSGRKFLAQAKPQSKLQRPTRKDDAPSF
jgi:hypothetical protein